MRLVHDGSRNSRFRLLGVPSESRNETNSRDLEITAVWVLGLSFAKTSSNFRISGLLRRPATFSLHEPHAKSFGEALVSGGSNPLHATFPARNNVTSVMTQ